MKEPLENAPDVLPTVPPSANSKVAGSPVKPVLPPNAVRTVLLSSRGEFVIFLKNPGSSSSRKPVPVPVGPLALALKSSGSRTKG